MYVSPNVDLTSVASATDMTTLLARLSAARALLLDNIDVAVSTARQRRVTTPGASIAPATGDGIDLPTGAVAHTYGAWVEMIASFAADGVLTGFSFVGSGTAKRTVVIDIGLGAGGAEVSTGEVPVGGLDVASTPTFIMLPDPIKVAAGTRVAMRARDDSGVPTNIETILQYEANADRVAWNA